jgi:hypothetical protein
MARTFWTQVRRTSRDFSVPGELEACFEYLSPVSDDSLIFESCKLGNIDGVRLLLDKGEASTWDTNSQGRTPLHVSFCRHRSFSSSNLLVLISELVLTNYKVAAQYSHPQLCEVLLDVRADAEARDDEDR